MKQNLLKTGTEPLTEIWFAFVEKGRIMHIESELDRLTEHEGYPVDSCYPVKVQIMPRSVLRDKE